jgi:transcription factor C subunit 6
VSTIPATQDPTTGSRCDPAVLGAVQIWSVPYVDDENLPSAAPAGARCELVLCFPGGPVMDIKWMPMGAWDDAGAMPKLGIAAVVQLDGSTVLYAVPHPAPLRAVTATQGPIYLKARAVAKFAVDDTASTAIQWLSGRRLAVGLSNGHLAIWDAVDAILAPEPEPEPPLPAMYLTLALSSIRSIAAGRTPPTDAAGALDYTGEAVYIAFGSYDGTTGVVDLRDPGNVIELNRSRRK